MAEAEDAFTEFANATKKAAETLKKRLEDARASLETRDEALDDEARYLDEREEVINRREAELEEMIPEALILARWGVEAGGDISRVLPFVSERVAQELHRAEAFRRHLPTTRSTPVGPRHRDLVLLRTAKVGASDVSHVIERAKRLEID